MFNKSRALALIVILAFAASAYAAFTINPPMTAEEVRAEVQAQQAQGRTLDQIAADGSKVGVNLEVLTQGMLLAVSTANAADAIAALIRANPTNFDAIIVAALATPGVSETAVRTGATAAGLTDTQITAAISSARTVLAGRTGTNTTTTTGNTGGTAGGGTTTPSQPGSGG